MQNHLNYHNHNPLPLFRAWKSLESKASITNLVLIAIGLYSRPIWNITCVVVCMGSFRQNRLGPVCIGGGTGCCQNIIIVPLRGGGAVKMFDTDKNRQMSKRARSSLFQACANLPARGGVYSHITIWYTGMCRSTGSLFWKQALNGEKIFNWKILNWKIPKRAGSFFFANFSKISG